MPDKHLVIVPNSVIGDNQMVSSGHPDPQCHMDTQVGITHGTDIETARQVEGVLPNRPVGALYIEKCDPARVFRVGWGIELYRDIRRVFGKVHTALQYVLDETGIECPFPTQTLDLQVMSETGENTWQASQGQNRKLAGSLFRPGHLGSPCPLGIGGRRLNV